MKENKFIYYSVIVPCYNEEHRIGDTVVKLRNFLLSNPGSEVIFVNDGSMDRTSEVIEKNMCGGMSIVELSKNIGKWGAICAGVSHAKKDYCIMSDADYSIDIKYFVSVLSLDPGKDIVIIGNRYNILNNIPNKRRIPGRVFNFLTRIFTGISYHDTQTPFKVWSNTEPIREIFSDIIECGFSGDVEFLKRCDLKGISIKTIDVRYKFVEGSSVSLKKHAWPMFKALWRIRKNVR